MKKQTWLKFLLCFLIITGTVSAQEANAESCTTCTWGTIVDGKCEIKDNVTSAIKRTPVINVDNKYYHKVSANCETCGGGDVYLENEYANPNVYRCVDTKSAMINRNGVYYHKSAVVCGTCNNGVVYIDSEGLNRCYAIGDYYPLYEIDNSRKLYHSINQRCSYCRGDICDLGNNQYKCWKSEGNVHTVVNYKNEFYHTTGYKCGSCDNGIIFLDSNDLNVCLETGENKLYQIDNSGKMYHFVAKCKTCNGSICDLDNGKYKCWKSEGNTNEVLVYKNEYHHKDTWCGTCCSESISNGKCNSGDTVLKVNGIHYHKATIGTCPTCGGAELYYGEGWRTRCTTYGDPVMEFEQKGGGFYHEAETTCNDCGSMVGIISGEYKCQPTGKSPITVHFYNGGYYHEVAKCISCNGGIIKRSDGKLYCLNDGGHYVDANYKHIEYTSGQTGNTGTTQVVTGGPSAEAFFNAANKDEVNNAFDVIDDNLDPVLHIQSLIMMLGVYIAVIVVLIYGIQWLLATPSKRQELKAGLWPLVIGVMLLILGPKLAIMIVNALLGIG